MSNHRTIKAWVAAGGLGPIPPTIAEVAKALEVSNSTARDWLERAVEAGLMEKTPGKARSYRLSKAGESIVLRT